MFVNVGSGLCEKRATEKQKNKEMFGHIASWRRRAWSDMDPSQLTSQLKSLEGLLMILKKRSPMHKKFVNTFTPASRSFAS